MKGTRERHRSAADIRLDGGKALASARGRADRKEDASQMVSLDPLIHERTRLAILTALATAEGGCCSFIDLRDALHITDGNLITHLRTLEQAGLVATLRFDIGGLCQQNCGF